MRRHFNKHIAIIVLAATLGFLSGCVDDMIWKSDPFGGAGIRLGVTVDGSWTNPSSKGTTTRSLGEDGEIIEQEEKAFQDYSISEMKTQSGNKVYLHEEVMSWDDANNESPVVTANKKQTRSYIVGSGEGFQPMYDKFGVTAFHYSEDSWPHSGFNVPSLFSNELAQGTAGTYNIPDKYMPAKGGVRMFAYAPANDPYVTYYDNLWEWNIGPALYVRTPKDPKDHKDLLVAYSGDYKIDNSSNNPVNLNFKHALTGIRFSLTDDMVNCTIKRVVIKNLLDQGAQYFANLGLWNAIVWSALSKSSDNAMIDMNNLNIKVGPRDDAYDTSIRYLAPMSETLFVIPQTCPADTEINIVIEQDDGNGKTHQELLVGYMGGKELKPGTIVTYRISYDGWWRGLTLTQPDAVNYYGDFVDMNVISFDISNGDIEKRPLPWRLEFCGMTEDEQPDGNWQPTPPENMLYMQSHNPRGVSYVPQIPDGEEFAGYYGSMIGATERPGYQIQMYFNEKWSDALSDYDWDYIGYLDDILYENTDKGAIGSEWNLSNPNGYHTGGYNGKGIWTTANCYVVDAPGEYIFPCIYGNGITNGQVNEKAYFPNLLGAGKENVISEGGILNRFINHLGNGIYNPVINKNAGCNTDENLKVAELEWTDANGMIENIKYDKDAFGGIGGIRFTIKRGSRMAMENNNSEDTEDLRTDQFLPNRIGGIRQGNTTISLKDKANGATMWSWHIWVNPIAYDTRNQFAVTNKTREKNQFMALTLGWVAMQEVKIMRPRGCFVRITNWRDITHMDGSTERVEKSHIVELYQREHFKYYHGFAPSYQWGRKDPFQPGYSGYNSVPWGDKNGWYGWGPILKHDILPETYGRELTGLKNRILNPNQWHELYKQGYANPEFNEKGSDGLPMGRDESYYNLWNATRNTCWTHTPSTITYAPRIGVTKTIYDPCPPGYKVPMLNSFTGFTVNGDNITLQGGGLGDTFEEMFSPQNWYGNAMEYQYVNLDLNKSDPMQWFREAKAEFDILSAIPDSIWTEENDNRYWELWQLMHPKLNHFQFFTDIKVKKHYVNLPMIGQRFMDGGTLTEIGTDGYFWTAECSDRNSAYYLCICNGRGSAKPHINPINSYYHLDGFQILPMVDEQAMGIASTINSAETPVYNLVKTLGPYSRKRPATPAEIEQIRKRREEQKKQAKLRMEQRYQQQQQQKNLRLPKITKLRN